MNDAHPGWTGGQWSVVRAVLGLYLAVHFAMLLPWAAELWSSEGVLPNATSSPLVHAFPNVFAWLDSPWMVTTAVGLGAVASVALALGWRDRWVALGLWFLWACLFGRNPLISNPGLPYIGVLLVIHACLPRAPYGSWEARHRTDPGGGWALPAAYVRVLWILMSVGYSYSGWTKLVSASWRDGSALARVLDNPLARPGVVRDVMASLPDGLLRVATYGALTFELAFLPLAWWSRTRPWVWFAMLGMHLSLLTLIDFADLSFGMVVLHAATFDPRWVRPRGDAVRVYYDGTCGLCHRFVRFMLAEDRVGAMRYAPLQGETLQQSLTDHQRRELPDSVVVETANGDVLVRSAAALAALASLGGLWGVVARVGAVVPAFMRDAAYDGLARVRRRLVAAPDAACPMLPASLRARFDP